jgi:ethanolamine utilization protein EutN
MVSCQRILPVLPLALHASNSRFTALDWTLSPARSFPIFLMFLAEVIGQVVSTKKDELMVGRKLLLLRPKLIDDKDPSKFKDGANTIVAIDTVGAGEGELVLFCQGSSARAAQGLKLIPVDAAIVAIIDRVEVHGKTLYKGG